MRRGRGRLRPASVSSSARASASEPSRRWRPARTRLGSRSAGGRRRGARSRRLSRAWSSAGQVEAAVEAAQVARRRDGGESQPVVVEERSASDRTDGRVHGRDGLERLAPASGPGRGAPPGRRSTTPRGACRPSAARGRRRGSAWPSPAPRRGRPRREAGRARPGWPRVPRRQSGRIDPGRDLERAGIRVVDEAGRDVVREPALLADGQEQPAAHPVTEHRVEDRQRPAVRMVAMEGRHAEAELRLRGVALAGGDARPGGQVGRRREPRDDPVAAAERVRDELDGLRRDRCRRRQPRPCLPAGTSSARSRGSSRAGRARMPSSSPQISRPSGPSPNIAAWNRIWQYSAGSSRYERISSTMTARSLSMSRSASVGRTMSSPTTSMARAASRRGTRTQ